jgi:hypothetical protein
MAVEIVDIAMAKEITDAVDTTLKKWKASLLEVWELAEDGITGTDHPFYFTTKAAADLHESTCHSCLASANARAQLGLEKHFVVTTETRSRRQRMQVTLRIVSRISLAIHTTTILVSKSIISTMSLETLSIPTTTA